MIEAQLETLRKLLRDPSLVITDDVVRKVHQFMEEFPRKLTDAEQQEILSLLVRPTKEKKALVPFDNLIPSDGWLRSYYEYTLRSEPPTVFHFASSLTVVGAALERQVYLDRGFYKLYPSVAVCLVAPTGRCRKTSATNIALSLARAVGITVLSDKVTPEALVTGLSGKTTSCGLVYAPELAVFLGKQKYLEGMVPLLTSLFDAPNVWTSSTIGRGDLKLHEVGLSFLAASTMEWFVEALPTEAFTGGFMSRIIFVAQERTDREFAFPEPGLGHSWEKLREELAEIKEVKGEVTLTKDAHDWYVPWYSTQKNLVPPDEKFAGYYARKPEHLLKFAYLLRVARDRQLQITRSDLELGLKILDWMEDSLPHVFTAVTGTYTGGLQQRVLQQLRQAGGRITHSTLLRKNQHVMNARQFREVIDTLKESGCIREIRSPLSHDYEVIE